MLNLNQVLVFSANPKKLVEFYSKLFKKKADWTGGEFHVWKVGGGMMGVGPHSAVKGKNKNPEQIMFMFESSDVAGEFNRIKGLGAKVIAKPYHPGEDPKVTMATLEDPDGNYFQLISPMKM